MSESAARPCKACGQLKPHVTYLKDGREMSRGVCRECLRDRMNEQQRERRRLRKSADLHIRATPVISAAAVRTIVVASDVHIPEHDRGAWGVFLAVLRIVRPEEVILAGDFAELESVSQHGGHNEAKLLEDVVSIRLALNEVRAAAGPDCRITYLEGNHETRLPRALASWAPSIRGSLTLPDLLDFEERGIEWVPEGKQPIDRGLLRVLHGHQVFGQGAGGIYHARKAADVYATDAGRIVTYGHTHKPQQFQRAVYGGQGRAVGLGCLRTIAPAEVGWLHGNESGWAHGFGVFSILAASVHVEEVRPVRGQAVFRGALVTGAANAAPG